MNGVIRTQPTPLVSVGRSVVFRTRGQVHGPVVRMVSASDETYQPPRGYRVGWITLMDGSLRTPDPVDKGELAVFDPSDAAIEFEAVTDARFVLGTAIQHPHDLHLGKYSVHTSPAALIEGEREIARIGRELRAKGVLR